MLRSVAIFATFVTWVSGVLLRLFAHKHIFSHYLWEEKMIAALLFWLMWDWKKAPGSAGKPIPLEMKESPSEPEDIIRSEATFLLVFHKENKNQRKSDAGKENKQKYSGGTVG